MHSAQEEAKARGCSEVGIGHLLLGLLVEPNSQALLVLDRAGVRRDELEAQVKSLMPPSEAECVTDLQLDREARRAFDLAFAEGTRNRYYLGTEHMLLGLAGVAGGIAHRALACQGVDAERLRSALHQLLREETVAAGEDPILGESRCGRNDELPAADKLLRSGPIRAVDRIGDGSAMWMRFTEAARKLVFCAHETAKAHRDSQVDTGYLLLGLLEDNTSFAIRLLDRAGVQRDELAKQVEALLNPPQSKPDADIGLTAEAKRSIDLAYEEARRLNNKYIGTEHLLLGMMGMSQGVAARALACQGALVDRMRVLVEQMQGEGRAGTSPEGADEQVATD